MRATPNSCSSIWRACLAIACASALAGCAQTGDFGRQRPNVINDSLLPVLGMVSTYSAGEPVSHFNYTDDERTLRNLGWTLVVPTHAHDWIGRTAAELQRAEIVRRLDLVLSPERYSELLSGQRYGSSEARYARIMDDAVKDMAAIQPYMAYVTRVRIADEQRINAAIGLPDIGASELAAAHGRIAENQRQIAWVKRAMLFRLYAYRYAVDRLMIETPSRLAGQTIDRLNALEALIQDALAVDLEQAPISHPGQRVDLLEIVAKA
ncbi:MAG: hypothetical protein ACE360_01890 [Hyphomicrobiales bacterium]